VKLDSNPVQLKTSSPRYFNLVSQYDGRNGTSRDSILPQPIPFTGGLAPILHALDKPFLTAKKRRKTTTVRMATTKMATTKMSTRTTTENPTPIQCYRIYIYPFPTIASILHAPDKSLRTAKNNKKRKRKRNAFKSTALANSK
jgi:hypothetical protein